MTNVPIIIHRQNKFGTHLATGYNQGRDNLNSISVLIRSHSTTPEDFSAGRDEDMLLQTHKTELRPLTTAHLAQTMSLMSLNALELRQKIEAELSSNPALEISPEHSCPTCHRPLRQPGPCPVCSQPMEIASETPIVFVSSREDLFRSTGKAPAAELPSEELEAEVEELPLFVFRQIAPELEPDDRPLAAHILSSLDEDGLLTVPLIEIARYHHVLPSRLSRVLNLIQHAEPIGVGSSSPQEALLIQLEVLAETRPVPPLAERAIREGMTLLSRHRYSELGRRLEISAEEARQLGQFIGDNLNPYPARAYWGDSRYSNEPGPDVYTLPDVLISQLNTNPRSALVVEVISPLAGRLRINPLFREALSNAPTEKSEQWDKHLESASLLIKCLQQRDHTIVRLMGQLANLQRDFILRGDAHLKPITRASLAGVLEVHESTISRAVANKAVQLPSGKIIPLSKFFDRSLHIRTALRQIISEENKPLTDTQLAKQLKKRGYSIARRTVAKYRSMEGILPAHMRSPAI